MQSVLIEIFKSVWTIACGKKLASVWLVSFAAASAGILARRLHKEPPAPWPGTRRPKR
jgi:hypothetical protein